MNELIYYSPSYYARFERRRLQIFAKLNENKQLFAQNIKQPKLALLGAFHGTNTGDNILGLSVLHLAQGQNITASLQNFNYLNKYPHCQLTVCAGGATGVEQNLIILTQRNKNKTNQTALVGMDFSSDIEHFPDEVLSFLSNVKYISCRSKRQANYLSQVLGFNNVHHHADNAFAYPFSSFKKNLKESRTDNKVLGFNSLNLFMTWVRGKGFTPGTPLEEWYSKTGNNITDFLRLIGPKYIEFLNKTLDVYISRGWKIVHIPFTIEDDLFVKTFFNQKNIHFYKFTPNPDKLFTRVQQCNLFISTRFHSLIFALMAGVPLIPINYAVKCKDLISDLELDFENTIDRMDFVKSFNQALEKSVNPKPIVITTDYIESLSNQASISITNAIKSII